MRQPPQFKAHPLGHLAETENSLIFFGNQNSSIEELGKSFPDLDFVLLRQTHSDIVIDSTAAASLAEQSEGDAHLTSTRRRALCIRTADCLPVMIEAPGIVAAAHAGWRGVENEILLKTGRQLVSHKIDLAKALAWIGPHILFDSFEVGIDVALKLEMRFAAVAGSKHLSPVRRSHPNPNKLYVNLLAIASAQLASLGMQSISILEINTLINLEHASYRRSGPDAGRNLSFIARK